ncbi:MAG: hypothetical protein EBY07_16525, partial [Actinobacteria bacterium]|nr:hypothetical protein [Actinomycetota bacterium]
MAFANRRGTHTSLQVERLTREGGMIPYAMTTASEFGGVNVTRTLLNGSTHNPWQHGRTPGGSSGGSAAAVAGGLCTIATAGDGGGSIRIPAGFCGLVGLKATYGRIPRAPMHYLGNLTVSTGCVSRSIRDTARWFDIANGHDARDPLSLPRVSGWEDELGSIDLRGLRVAVVSDWGGATVSPAMWTVLEEVADWLIRNTGMRRVDDVNTTLPSMGAAWSISGMISIREELGDLWPGCADDLTPEIRMGLQFTEGLYGSQARHKIETRRAALNERMAEIFRNVDIVILYPRGRVSEVQRRQMTTVDSPNVHCVAIDGTFDDCQDLVKAMFNDESFRKDNNLSAVNSINWARVMAQTVYYFTALRTLGRRASFSVPTGNFGNVLAGWIAREMGADVHHLIVGSNSNDIL